MVTSDGLYISRPLAQTLRKCRHKVAIIEGARAVGKTMLVQHELSDGYHYETLADESTFKYASQHLTDWLDSLPLPCIIDEAQRIPELPLEVKTIVDSSSKQTPIFILTGSASITRDGLSGQDPLTRRSQRYSLSPMTLREIKRNASISIVDLLWNGTPLPKYSAVETRDDLARHMSIGGFPTYALPSIPLDESSLRLSIQTDIDNVLGDTVLPGERLDKSIAEAVLRELLSTPGGILNVQRVSNTIESQPITVERYISIFVRRFLITALPNLRSAPNKQIFTRAKIHPVDTSFSVEILKQAGKDFRKDKVLFGQLFESFAINQIVAEIPWSQIHPDAFYWREPGKHPKEVDLVLVHDNELIAIEIKSNTHVDRQDFAGIAALKATDHRFKRGFVLYTGTSVQQFGPTMWAIPVSALWDGDGFEKIQQKTEEAATMSVSQQIVNSETIHQIPTDANLFLSYSHQDNDYLDDGIVLLLQDVVKEYTYQFGNTLGLFIDKFSINWGEDWKTALERSVDAANIIIPAITPHYIRSEQCRKELLDFNARVGTNSTNRILPLIVQSIEEVSGIDRQDPVWRITHDKQWLKLGELRMLSGQERQQRIFEIVTGLRTVIKEIEQMSTASDSDRKTFGAAEQENSPAEEPDLLQSWSQIENLTPELSTASNTFGTAITAIAQLMNDNTPPVNGTSADYLAWSTRFADVAQPKLDALDTCVTKLSSLWESAYAAMTQYVDFISTIPQGSARNEQIDNMSPVFNGITNSMALPSEIPQAMAQLRLLGNFVKPLRPLSNSMEGSITLIENMSTMIASLQGRLDQLPR